jgi:predicted ribosomally synthesized peptide with nif11-like leader
MSIDHAKEFLKELNRNDELKAKLSACTTAVERMNIAKESGFEFTVEEFIDARAELFDGELNAMSGGGYCNGAIEGHCGFTNESCRFDGCCSNGTEGCLTCEND